MTLEDKIEESWHKGYYEGLSFVEWLVKNDYKWHDFTRIVNGRKEKALKIIEELKKEK